jgi:hypothetical protein
LIVKEADEYVSKRDCAVTVQILSKRVEVLERQFGEIREEMKKDSNRLSVEGEARSRRLHERIEGISQSLGHDIQAMPEKIIGLLKQTGAI